MKLIVGLGNPGSKYEKTRHNLGFMVLDEYVRKNLDLDASWDEETKFKSEVLKISNDLWLVKPQTFMNNSGEAVTKIANFYKVLPEDIIIVHDDLDLMLGKIKIRLGGAAAGHHGVESVINSLGTDQFLRIRLGIGGEKPHRSVEHFVVEDFVHEELPSVKHMVKQAAGALGLLLSDGLEVAQNKYH